MEGVQFEEIDQVNMSANTSKINKQHKAHRRTFIFLIIIFCMLLVIFGYLLRVQLQISKGRGRIQQYMQVDQRPYRSDFKTLKP